MPMIGLVRTERFQSRSGVFRSHRSKLLGLFFYRWEDQERCWQCGSPANPKDVATYGVSTRIRVREIALHQQILYNIRQSVK